ncbi:MAG TPA: type 2 lanthipeptide synthetase LanM family protein [Ktedonobacteraceae bacterium]|nr:type 2 lanthipeptide synthetase LanM family protein [Ktedonobacteraceae bacterium]
MQEVVSEHLQNSQVAVNNPCWYRAMTLMERLASLQTQRSVPGIEEPCDRELAARKLQEWKEQDAFSKGINFAQRLESDHLTEEDLLVLLGEPIEAVQQRTPPPDWLLQLAEVFASVDLASTMAEDPQQPAQLSLLNIFDTFSQYAHDRFISRAAALETEYKHLPFDPQTTVGAFLPNLIMKLSPAINRTMVLELHVARLQGRLHGETPEERFQDFIRQMRQKQALQALLEEYPVLARQIMIIINHWLNNSLECLHHLCSDWQQICTTFSPEREPGWLIEALGEDGDMHRGGRSMLKLRFSAGLQLLYKPETVEVDLHFQEMLTWLNEQGYQPPFRTMRLLPGEGYGWSEFVEASDCSTQAEIVRFYERQGGYLALLYALGATNFHYESVTASGEDPIFIELDALFHARSHETIDFDAAMDVLHFSVIRVGMLPTQIFLKPVRQGPEVSASEGHEGQQAPQSGMLWAGVGTDQMHLVRESHTQPGKNNRPQLDGNDVDPLEYQHCLVAGFKRMYRLLMTRGKEFASVPLARFASDEIRRMVRPAHFYRHLLHESFHPYLLRDALERGCHFEHLWQAAKLQPDLARLVRCERSDLLVGDIPTFNTRPDTRDIFSSRADCITDFLAQPGIALAQQTVLKLHEDDLERQCWFIGASFSSLLMEKGQLMWKHPTVTVPSGKVVTRERLLAAACRIGDRLCQLATGDWRGVNWVGVTLMPEHQWFLTSMMPDLYEGNAGIILFLSYLGVVTGDTRYSDMAESAYITMYKQVERFEAHPQALDVFEGLSSVIYLLSHLGTIWNDPTLLAEAHGLAKQLPELMQKDTALDLLSGSARCILSLLSLYRASPKPETLAIAVMCGDHLLEKARLAKDGLAWERAVSAEPPAAMAHGTAGSSLSLFALAAISGEERFHKLALATLAYERSVFPPQAQNWPDILKPEQPAVARHATPTTGNGMSYQASWCHGAPGIGLSRLASLSYIDDEKIREEIAIALKTTIASFGLNHSLGHGDLGNLETLLVATQVLDDPWCYEQCHHFRSLIVDSIETDGWLTGAPAGIETPGLMTGLAGIGYELLRLAEPERVPSVLLAAPPLAKTAQR